MTLSHCSSPNQHARPARLELLNGHVYAHGYQEFWIRSNALGVLPEDHTLQKKHALLTPFFTPAYLKHRIVLDLGANAGFYSFWALQSGADGVVALDLDNEYIGMIEAISAHLKIEGVCTVWANVMDWHESADIVCALALVHWMYSCTTDMGSLSSVIEYLSSLTKYMLIVEWVSPDDPAIMFFNHLKWNPDVGTAPYTLEAFESALHEHFRRVEIIGEVSATRRLYVAFRHEPDIHLSGPLPLLFDKEIIISSKLLTSFNGVDYWSRVYDLDSENIIVKQATLDLASREYFILKEFDTQYFPKSLEYKDEGNYSQVSLEKIRGIYLPHAVETITSMPEGFKGFMRHCLNILRELHRHGVMHRDLYPSNFIIRDSIPVLIDFGWAISEKYPIWSPQELGYKINPPDKSSSDVFGMGKLFEYLNRGRYLGLEPVIELMINPDRSLRIEDLDMLEYLLDLAL